MEEYLKGLKAEMTPELEVFRKEFEDHYDDLAYLKDLGNRLALYNELNKIAEGYILLDEIDDRILELEHDS